MNPQPARSLLLNIGILLLLILIGMQVYGIFSDGPVNRRSDALMTAADTGFVPIQINVLNGCGVSGVGGTMTKFCRQAAYDVVEMGNYKSFDVEESMVIDRTGKKEDAYRLASALGIKRKNVVQQFSSEHLVSASVVIGKDYRTLNPWK